MALLKGMMIGGYVWGYLADQKGRQRVLMISLTLNGVFGALASLALKFWLFLLLRFFSGIGVGGSIPVIFYFSEFQPRTKRGVMISGLATFWMAGNLLAAGLAWLVIPNTYLSFQLGTLEFQSWRLFVVLWSIPSLSSALIFGLVMPESPKFLMEVLEPIQKLFSDHLTSRSIILLIIFFCISFGHYGLWMWFPELFTRIEDGGYPCANASQSSSSATSECHLLPCENQSVHGALYYCSCQSAWKYIYYLYDGRGGIEGPAYFQPPPVGSQHVLRLGCPVQDPDPDHVVFVQRGLCHRLERSGCHRHRALPHAAPESIVWHRSSGTWCLVSWLTLTVLFPFSWWQPCSSLDVWLLSNCLTLNMLS